MARAARLASGSWVHRQQQLLAARRANEWARQKRLGEYTLAGLRVPYRCAPTAACCWVAAAAAPAAPAARCLAAASSASFFLRATHLLCWYTWKKVPTCICEGVGATQAGASTAFGALEQCTVGCGDPSFWGRSARTAEEPTCSSSREQKQVKHADACAGAAWGGGRLHRGS